MSTTHTSWECESRGMEDVESTEWAYEPNMACLGLGNLGASGLDGDGSPGCRRNPLPIQTNAEDW
jgi:hypothetical protein